MQCRLRGLAGALLTLLCTGLLSLRYHLSLSPKGSQEIPGLSPPSHRPPELQLRDVFIAVKTTRIFHRSRLELLLDTWVSRIREQVTSWLLRAPGVAPGLRDSQRPSYWVGVLGGLTGEAACPPPHSPRLPESGDSCGPGRAPRWPWSPLLLGLTALSLSEVERLPQASGSLPGVPLFPGCFSAGFTSALWVDGGCWAAAAEASEVLADMRPGRCLQSRLWVTSFCPGCENRG